MKRGGFQLHKIITLLAGVGVLAAACGGSSGTSAAQSPAATSSAGSAPAVITYGLLPATNDAPVIVASRLGYYSQAGVKISLQLFNGGPLLMQAIAAGSVDGGLSGTPPVVEALSGGVPIKVVNGPGTVMMPAALNMDDLVVTRASGITSVKQLKGRTIAVQTLGATGDLLVEKYVLPSAGLSASDVHIVELHWSDMGKAFAAGQVDGGTPFTPFLQRILKTEGTKVRVLANTASYFPGKSFPLAVDVFSTSALAKLGPKPLQAFLTATERGVTYVQQHPAKAQHMLESYLGLPPAALAQVPFGQFVGQVNEKAFQTVADALYSLKRIPRKVDIAAEVVDVKR